MVRSNVLTLPLGKGLRYQQEVLMFVIGVEGMSCQNCVRHVTAAIMAQDAKARVEVKLAEKLVHIESKAPLEKIRRAIENDGYRITTVEQRP